MRTWPISLLGSIVRCAENCKGCLVLALGNHEGLLLQILYFDRFSIEISAALAVQAPRAQPCHPGPSTGA
jgi:hypothetical protein